jgi:hypothetical protein
MGQTCIDGVKADALILVTANVPPSAHGTLANTAVVAGNEPGPRHRLRAR